MLRASIADDPALAINAMCSALAHEIADTFAMAVVVHGATEEMVDNLIDGYSDGIRRGFHVQLAYYKAQYAEYIAEAGVQTQ